ncbi:MAG TPA: hypothetical protein DCY13_23920 [Verrucomicrobiales bacterium]|nr:hypothetical protein [Verrucomicrobiales bacterium]
MNPAVTLAQVIPVDTPRLSPAWWDFLLVAGVIAGLTALIFIVAAMSRRQRSRKRKSRRGPEILKNTEEHLRQQSEVVEGGEAHRIEKRNRRRREHRPRNPTLAERGGLPPARDSGSAPNSGL